MQSHPASSSDSALGVAVDLRRLPWMRRLAVDYAYDYARLASFFAGDPALPASWSAAIARVQAHDRPRDAVSGLIRAQQERREAPAAARSAAAALADPATVAIVTGQQAGLFGGPLFTLLKALTAVRLAERVAREHGVTAVPVFWIDAEDHDWDEVRSARVLDGELELREVSADPPEGAGTRTVASLSWTEAITHTTEALRAALPETEFTAWLTELTARAYAPGRSVADGFARMLEGVLGEHGLVVYDASDPAAKPLVAELFASELAHAGRTSLLAARAGADLVAQGYHMQVTPHAGQAALFEIEGGRRALQIEGDTAVLADGARIPTRELVERARRSPEHFSPNVLLRPLVQDTLFPTVCYVAGPNELAYLAQLRQVYAAFGVPMPLVQLRASASIVDAAALRFLTRYQVRVEELQPQDESALNQLLRDLLPPSVERSLDDAERELQARMETIVSVLPAVDPTLEGRARSVAGRIQHELEGLRGKVLQAAKRRDDTLRRQFLHARAQIFPHGEPQERVVSGVSFLARYGPGFAARLREELPLDPGVHWVLSV